MKITTLILGILGVLTSLGLGATWYTDYNEYKDKMAQISSASEKIGGDVNQTVSSLSADFENLGNASIVLLVGSLLGLIATLLVFKKSKITAIVLVIIALAPVLFSAKALVGTFLFLLAGVFAFFVKPKNNVMAGNN